MRTKQAFISVYDKTGIVDFARKLSEEFGYKLISTGGTYRELEAKGIEVTEISEITGFVELLNGKVKSLHPKIHAGILASGSREDEIQELSDNNIDMTDMVIVNLYPFEEASKDADLPMEKLYEYIDIGGVTLLRAAAKNFFRVTSVYSPDMYDRIIEELGISGGDTSYGLRKELAIKTFAYTSSYDSLISEQLAKRLVEGAENKMPETFNLNAAKVKDLRYGENPHQKAALYEKASGIKFEVLNGKELSYNNMVDMASALNIVSEFTDVPAACIIKHNNPCGAAIGVNITDAYLKAHLCDPISAFGGIIGLNLPVTKEIAEHAVKIFFEVIVAPDFTEEALEILKTKKNLRLVKLNSGFEDYKKAQQYSIKDLPFGTLIQDADKGELSPDSFKVVTKTKPDSNQIEDMIFAWKIVKHVGSNAIVVARDLRTIGIGMGQTSRIASMEIALSQACDETTGAVIASDGFFPATDNIHAAAQARVGAIIQPGGSIKDADVIAECDKFEIPMITTGLRHFKH